MQNSNRAKTYLPLTGLVYLFNLIVGTGTLTMPAAFANSGWLISLVVVILLCFISYITTTFVIESMSSANAIIKYQKSKSIVVHKPNLRTGPENEDQSLYSSSSANISTEMVRFDCIEKSDQSMDSYFEINQRIELGAMANMFFSKFGVQLFYISITIYLFGDLSIYAAAISKSLRDVTCDFEHKNCNQSLSLSDQCWTKVESVDRRSAYRIYLALTLIFIGPLAFFNLQKTKYLQILTTFLRWIAFTSMITMATIALIRGKASGKPKAVVINGLPDLFGVCVYSFMCHHSLPALITPIRDKKRLFTLIFTDYILILVFYSLLSFTGIFTFNNLKDIYTLNFQVEKCSSTDEDRPVPQVPVLDYFLPLFPVFTLSTNFPIIAITLQNNLKAIFTSNSQNSSFFKRKLLYPLIAIVPPFAVSFATEDLEILVGVVGSYAGASIQYIFPALLVYFSRKKIFNTCPALVSTDNKLISPFSHRIWILLVLVWFVICILFVTTNHIIDFTR